MGKSQRKEQRVRAVEHGKAWDKIDAKRQKAVAKAAAKAQAAKDVTAYIEFLTWAALSMIVPTLESEEE